MVNFTTWSHGANVHLISPEAWCLHSQGWDDVTPHRTFSFTQSLHALARFIYGVKVQTSLAPLSWFPGSRVPTAHVHQCCRFQSYAKTAVANEIDNEIDEAWTNIPGIHDNGPRDHGVWRLTLTAYKAIDLVLVDLNKFPSIFQKIKTAAFSLQTSENNLIHVLPQTSFK